MGLFGGIVDKVKHLAGDAVGAVKDGVESAVEHTVDFVGDHWKTFVTIGVGVVAFVGTAALIGALPFTAPLLATYFVSGVASGVASQAVRDLLNGKTPGWDVARSGITSGIFSAVTAGTINLVAPSAATAAENAGFTRVASFIARQSAGGGASGGAAAEESIATSAASRTASAEATSALEGSGSGAIFRTVRAEELRVSNGHFLRRSPKAHGIIGVLTGEDGSDPGKHRDALAAPPEAVAAPTPTPAPSPAPRPGNAPLGE